MHNGDRSGVHGVVLVGIAHDPVVDPDLVPVVVYADAIPVPFAGFEVAVGGFSRSLSRGEVMRKIAARCLSR